MKHLKPALLCALLLSAYTLKIHAQSSSLVGKNMHQVIGLWGSNYKWLSDAQGLHVMQYKRVADKDTVSDLLYFEGFTCVKEESLRPETEKNKYIDSLNQQFKPLNNISWMGKDSSYVTIATRDGFLDITSFSAAYYKKIAH